MWIHYSYILYLIAGLLYIIGMMPVVTERMGPWMQATKMSAGCGAHPKGKDEELTHLERAPSRDPAPLSRGSLLRWVQWHLIRMPPVHLLVHEFQVCPMGMRPEKLYSAWAWNI